MTFGIDYAWGRPGASALNKAGVKFVVRYLSHDTTGKNLTPDEAKALSAAGIWIAVIWESTASRTLAGRSAGVADATAALKQALTCGMPAGRPIYFAVDFDATGPQMTQIYSYFDGVVSVLGWERVGVYGGFAVVHNVRITKRAAWGWQTYAWSHGNWYSGAQLQQYSNGHSVNGVGCDYNRAMKSDFGQWRVGVTPTPTPAPTPAPTPKPVPTPTPTTEDDMPYGQLAEGHAAITPIALPRGRYKTIGFTCDNGLQQLPAAKLRVAVHAGTPGAWSIYTPTVDSKTGQAVVTFSHPLTTDGISVCRVDAGDVHVAWEVS